VISKSTQFMSKVNKELQGIHIGDLHPLKGKSGLDMSNLF